MKDLSGKTVKELDWEDFDKLFCAQCKEKPGCDQDPKTVSICLLLMESGIWDSLYRKPIISR